MEAVLLVDVDANRADLICNLLVTNQIPVKICDSITKIVETIQSNDCPAVIVIHCALIHKSFTDLAKLQHHPNVKMIFYCTDQDERSRGSVAKLPEDLTEIILRIAEVRRALQRVS